MANISSLCFGKYFAVKASVWCIRKVNFEYMRETSLMHFVTYNTFLIGWVGSESKLNVSEKKTI